MSDWTPSEFQDRSHSLMQEVEMQITGELERAGFDPCPAIKIAQAATAKAWDVWNELVTENERLRAALEAEH